jgi:hypothetical protein
VSELDAQVLGDTVPVVAKYERDVQRSREALPRLVDPNATVPASLGHEHGHTHSHGSHTHGGHTHDHDHEDDGRRVRAAKDAPGRHDQNYYGQQAPTEPGRPHRPLPGRCAPGRAPGRSPPTAVAARGGGRSDVEGALHRFIRLLRLRGMRISTAEAIDAYAAAAAIGVSDRSALEAALGAALLKDRRDAEVFADTFARFFGLRAVVDADEGHGHAHDDLADNRRAAEDDLVAGPRRRRAGGAQPRQAGRHQGVLQARGPRRAVQPAPGGEQGRPGLADPADRAVVGEPRRAHRRAGGAAGGARGCTTRACPATWCGVGHAAGPELSVAQQQALRDWLADPVGDLDPEVAEALRRQLAGVIEDLPELLAAHLQKLAEMTEVAIEERELARAPVEKVTEAERARIEESLRRLATSLHGGLTHKKRSPRADGSTSRARCGAT